MDAPVGAVADCSDCDDTSATTSPSATELCNEVDDNCDGVVDESGAPETWYLDSDTDGYGDLSSSFTTTDCLAPSGYVANSDDCDDGNTQVSPEAEEICGDEIDSDCDGADEACLPSVQLSTAKAYAGYFGRSEDDNVGVVVGAGDVDGDGKVEIAVSGKDNASEEGEGALYLLDPAPLGSMLLAEANATVLENRSDQYIPSAMAMDDIDGDGYDDLIVGSRLWSCDPDFAEIGQIDRCGRVFVIDGPLSATANIEERAAGIIHGTLQESYVGWAIDTGDVDGDGLADLLVGSPITPMQGAGGAFSSGGAWLMLGPIIGEARGDDMASFSFATAKANDDGGWAVSIHGDDNGDGIDDVAIGAPTDSDAAHFAGAVWVKQGPITANATLADVDAKLIGVDKDDQAGWDVEWVGDTNGDGFDDLLVGAWLADEGGLEAGTAYLVSGPVSLPMSLDHGAAMIAGNSAGDNLGRLTAGVGDLDGDGFSDLLVSAIGESTNGAYGGGAWAFLGPLSGVHRAADAQAWLLGQEGDAIDRVAGLGDIDDDGLDDFIIGAYCESTYADCNGAAYAFLGSVLQSG